MEETLTKTNARGVVQFWSVKVTNNKINISWGIENGKIQHNETIIEKGKQKRSIQEQALFEAKSLMDKKLRTGYFRKNENAKNKSPLPMLAKEYKPSNENVALQPKLDGIRCLANVKTGELWSRKQTLIQGLDHISNALKSIKFPENVTWVDGELYKHGCNFNEISSKVRRTTNFIESNDIQYWIYDMLCELPFYERSKLMNQLNYNNDYIVLTPTVISNDVKMHHEKAVKQNFEGIMIRDLNGKYEIGKRSKNLYKYKDCLQEEFEVIGFKQKKVVNGAITLGSVILKDYKDDKLVFSATPTMTNEEKKHIWENQNDYLGLIATIKFFEKTPKGVPRFPRLIGFRHPDDC